MVKIKPSKKELEQLYIIKKLSVKKLAEHFRVANDTVKNWIINHNLDYRGFGPRKIPKDFIRPSKEELSNLYNKQKLTLREIGKNYNVTKITIKRWFNEYNLKVRSDPSEAKFAKKDISLPDKEQLIRDYELLSIELIAKKYGVSTEPILTLLDKYGIQKRNRTESKKLAEKTGRYVSWNKGKDMSNPRVAEMIKHLHKRQMEKMSEIKVKVSTTKKRLYSEGKIKPWNKGKTGIFSEETINKIREARLRQKPTQGPSKPEKLMRILLEKNNLTSGLVEEYPLKIGKVFTKPDFAYPDKKIAIYCDGEYYHGGFYHINQSWDKMKDGSQKENINKTMERDAKQHFALWENGWTPLRFWAHLIEKHPESVIEQIKKNLFDKEFIKEREGQRKEFLTTYHPL